MSFFSMRFGKPGCPGHEIQIDEGGRLHQFSEIRHFFRTVAGEDQEVSIDRFVEGCMAWSSVKAQYLEAGARYDTIAKSPRAHARSCLQNILRWLGFLDFLKKSEKTKKG